MLKERAEIQNNFNPVSSDRPTTAASPPSSAGGSTEPPVLPPEPAAPCPAWQLGTSFAPSTGKVHACCACRAGWTCSCTLGYLPISQNMRCVLPAGCNPKHSHVLFIQPFCSPPSPRCFLIEVRSSSVCFNPAFIDLSSGFPRRFLAVYVRDTSLPVKQRPHVSKDRLMGKSTWC